jgi:hypothetical protein
LAKDSAKSVNNKQASSPEEIKFKKQLQRNESTKHVEWGGDSSKCKKTQFAQAENQ